MLWVLFHGWFWITANPLLIPKDGTSNITANLLYDSNGLYHNPINGHIPDGIPIYFNTTLGIINSPVVTLNGSATAQLGSGDVNGRANVSATDNQSVHTIVQIDTLPPNVKTVDPSNNSVQIPSNKVITITFSEPIKTGNGLIELKNGFGIIIPITTNIKIIPDHNTK